MREDHVGPQGDQLFRQRLRLGAGGRKTSIDADVMTLRPSEPLELLSKFHEARLGFRTVRGQANQHPDAPHPRALLRARRARPRGRRRAADERHELAASHSITSSARASNVAGTSRPSVLAVFRLITNSNLVAACTGRSAGFSPLRMRSM